MIERALSTSFGQTWLILVSAVAIVLATVAYVRISGLRSFSKMSAFDFAVTVAVGSVMGSTAASTSTSLAEGVVALGGLFGAQTAIAALRRYAVVQRIVDNRPVVLMAGRRMLHDNLRTYRISEDDIRARLRAANVLNYDTVRAVVLETTGDISVLRGTDELDLDILDDVRDRERLAGDDGSR